MSEIIFPPLIGFTIIDTETNGLMDYKRPADADGQPRVAELAMIDVDLRGEVQTEWQRYVQPVGWSMSAETTKINNITDATLMEHGVPIGDVLDAYTTRILSGRAIVAFGAQFDCKMMRAELRRAGRDDLFEQTPNICLMLSAPKFGKLLGRKIPKWDWALCEKTGEMVLAESQKGWPKLADFAAFCGVPVGPKLHGGLEDARLKALCFRYMLENGFIPMPEVHHAKNYDEIRSAK